MNAERFAEWLVENGACDEGIEAAKGATLAEAWAGCERADWMMWMCARLNPDKVVSVRVAVFSARLCLGQFEKEHLKDNRPRKAIEAAEAWLADPSEENRAAASAAWAAASAASAEWAAWAAWAVGAASAVWAAAGAATNKKACSYIRELIPVLDNLDG